MTKETQFTPGPWKYGVDELGAACVYVPQNDRVDAILYMEPKGGWEDYANSWLIAQSPSLYANAEISCYVMSRALDFIQRRLTKQDNLLRLLTKQDNLLIIEMLKRQIETTDKLLAKCRGEVKEDE